MTLQEFENEFVNFIANNGDDPENWYIGIAADAEDRLFDDHNVDKQNGTWKYKNAGTEDNARAAEKYLIENLGTQGDTGGGSEDTTFVYAYKITYSTVES